MIAMSPIRLFVDEDASQLAVIAGLRARGIDLLTAYEAGRLGASDESQLDFARSSGRALYAFNGRDFSRSHVELLQRGESHAGIIVIPKQRYSIGEKVRRIAKFVATNSAESIADQIFFL
jgi:hypothetical protein